MGIAFTVQAFCAQSVTLQILMIYYMVSISTVCHKKERALRVLLIHLLTLSTTLAIATHDISMKQAQYPAKRAQATVKHVALKIYARRVIVDMLLG